jgi:D-alanine transaminase
MSIVFLNGDYLPEEKAKISVNDRGFFFADGVYEVVRLYGGVPFEADMHWERLKHSLASINLEEPDLDWRKIMLSLWGKNDYEGDGILYLQITRGTASRDHGFPPDGTKPTVFAKVSSYPRPVDVMQSGASAILHDDLRWERCDIKSISLLPNVLAYQRAKEAGVREAILHRKGIVTEASRSNVFGVYDGEIHTHPATQRILNGISRRVVIELANEEGIPLVERALFSDELLRADEVFITNTTAEVIPITIIDNHPIGNGKRGTVAEKLQSAFWKRIKQKTS